MDENLHDAQHSDETAGAPDCHLQPPVLTTQPEGVSVPVPYVSTSESSSLVLVN